MWAMQGAHRGLYAAELSTLCRPPRCRSRCAEQLSSFLSDATTEALVRLDGPALEAFLVNDVYKPRMHKLYAHELAGVSLEWEMHVRKSPIHLTDIERHVSWREGFFRRAFVGFAARYRFWAFFSSSCCV